MNRFAFAVAVCLVTAQIAPGVLAQTKPANQAKQTAQAPATKAAPAPAPTASAPAAPAKFVKPIKGTANIEIIQGPSKRVGTEVVTVIKVKNTSAGAIGLLKIDEYWYDKKPKPEVVTGDQEVYRKPFLPGEVIEMTMKSPVIPGKELFKSNYMYSHAGGDVKVKVVKKFE